MDGGDGGGETPAPAPADTAAVAAAARAQAAELAALAVRGHPNRNYNVAFMPAGEREGWPRFESAEKLHLYRHVESERWVFSCEAQFDESLDDLDGAQGRVGADRRAHLAAARGGRAHFRDGPRDGGGARGARGCGHGGKAAAEAEQEAEKAAAVEQLNDVKGVELVGRFLRRPPELNSVYLPSGDHEGWPRFESGEGKHLFFSLRFRMWMVCPAFNPDAATADAAVSAKDGLLPAGKHEWANGDEVEVSLLLSAGEVAERTERLPLEREERQAAEAELEAAALAAATDQLQDAAGVAVEGFPLPDFNGVYLPLGDQEGWPRFESGEGKHLHREIGPGAWCLRDPAVVKAGGWVSAGDGRLPVGNQTWVVTGADEHVTLTVSLIDSAEEVAEQTERLQVVREKQQAAIEADEAAAVAEQLQGVMAVRVRCVERPDVDGIYSFTGNNVGATSVMRPRFCQLHNGAGEYFALMSGMSCPGMLHYGWCMMPVFPDASPPGEGPLPIINHGPALPVGESVWQIVRPDGRPVGVRLTVTLLRSAKDLADHAVAAAKQQLRDVAGVAVESPSSLPELNDVYLPAGEKEELAIRFESEQGKQLCLQSSIIDDERWACMWHVRDIEFDPEKADASASFWYTDGRLPVGEHDWKGRGGGEIALAVTILQTEEAVAQHTERLQTVRAQKQAAKAAAEKAVLAAAIEQLRDVAGVVLEGHPELNRLNDVYLPAGDHQGWPRFESAQGNHLFRSLHANMWFLSGFFDKDGNARSAQVADELPGELRIGRCEWQVWNEQKWSTLVVTVSLIQSVEEVAEQTERLRARMHRLIRLRAFEKTIPCLDTRHVTAAASPETDAIYKLSLLRDQSVRFRGSAHGNAVDDCARDIAQGGRRWRKRCIAAATDPAALDDVLARLGSQWAFRFLPFGQVQPIHLAAMHGSEECMRKLVEAFGDKVLRSLTYKGMTPAHYAAKHGHLGCLRFCVTCQAFPILFARNEKDELPAHLAARYGHVACLQLADNPVVEQQYNKWLQSQQECTLGNGVVALMIAQNLGRLIVTKSLHLGFEEKVDHLWGPFCAGAFVVRRSHDNGPKDPEAISIETIVAYGQSTRGTPSPAHVAARCGRAECLTALLQMGADLSAKDTQGCTPVHLAAEYGHVACLEVFAAFASDAEKRRSLLSLPNLSGATPAHLAARGRHVGCLGALSKLGADLWKKDAQGTPHYWSWGDIDSHTVGYMSCGELNRCRRGGNTVVHEAARNGSVECLEFLLTLISNAKREELEVQRLSQLRKTAGDGGIGQELVDAALDNPDPQRALIAVLVPDEEVKFLSTANGNGHTPAHCAAKNGHEAVLSFLFQRGASATFVAKDEHGNTPLHLAARLQDVSCLLYLVNHRRKPNLAALERTPDWELQNKFGWTLGHFAANGGSLACLQLLAQLWPEGGLFLSKTYGTDDLDDQDFIIDGNTLPHHWAARAGHCECLRFLLEHCSKPQMRQAFPSEGGDTPAHWAFETNVREVPWELRWTPGLRLEPVDSAQKLKILRIFHEWLPDRLCLKNNGGRTLAHMMAEQGELQCLRLLLSSGLEDMLLSAQDNEGLTPVHWAIKGFRSRRTYSGTPEQRSALLDTQIEARFDCLETLVDLGAGASVCLKESAKGRCPGHWMMRDYYHCDRFSLDKIERELRLLQRAHPDALSVRDASGQTPAHHIRNHHGQLFALLNELGSGASLGQRDRRGQTPAHMASKQGDIMGTVAIWRQICEIGHGGSLSWKDEDGRTPFLVAVETGSCPSDSEGWSEAVEFMVEIAPDSLLAADNYGRTAAHYAAGRSSNYSGNQCLLEALARHGAAFTFYAKDDDGITPGAYAAFLAQSGCLSALHSGLATIIDPALHALRPLERTGGPTITNAIADLESDRNVSRDLGFVVWRSVYDDPYHEGSGDDGSGTSVSDICAQGFPSIDLRNDGLDVLDAHGRFYRLEREMECLALLKRIGALDRLVDSVTPDELDGKYARLLLDSSLLPLEKKQGWLHQRLERRMEGANAQTLSLTSARADILQGMCAQLGVDEATGQIAAHATAQALDVQFQDENGAGDGVRREWFDLAVAEMIDPKYGLFLSRDGGRTLQPSPHSQLSAGADHLSYFALLGRIAGFAIHHEAHLNVCWTAAFIKAAFGFELTPDDLQSVDPDLFESRIVYLRDSKYVQDGMPLDDLELTFEDDSNQEEYSAIGVSTELKAGGGAISVTEENKVEYLQLFAEHRLLHAIRPQVQAFRDGLAVIVDDGTQTILRRCCTCAELQLLMCGMPDIDVADWREHTEYSGFEATDEVVAWFWAVVDEMSAAEREKLLAFCTGSARVPGTGFANLMGFNGARKRFKIERLDGSAERLPVAATCFNTLKLVAYPSKRVLEEKLLLTMRESAGFDEAAAA